MWIFNFNFSLISKLKLYIQRFLFEQSDSFTIFLNMHENNGTGSYRATLVAATASRTVYMPSLRVTERHGDRLFQFNSLGGRHTWKKLGMASLEYSYRDMKTHHPHRIRIA